MQIAAHTEREPGCMVKYCCRRHSAARWRVTCSCTAAWPMQHDIALDATSPQMANCSGVQATNHIWPTLTCKVDDHLGRGCPPGCFAAAHLWTGAHPAHPGRQQHCPQGPAGQVKACGVHPVCRRRRVSAECRPAWPARLAGPALSWRPRRPRPGNGSAARQSGPAHSPCACAPALAVGRLSSIAP